MQTNCCKRPHYVESSNGQQVYCVNCGTAKPLIYTTYPVIQPIWVAPYYQPYSPYYQPSVVPYCGDATNGTLTGTGGSINITSSVQM